MTTKTKLNNTGSYSRLLLIVLFFLFIASVNSKSAPDTCGVEAFNFPNFSNVKNLHYNGSAVWQGNTILTNRSVFFAVGAVWYPVKVPVKYGFIVRFDFTIGDRDAGDAKDNSAAGADGLAFVIQNDDLGALGMVGDGIGYAGIVNSLAVEFDTYNDSYPKQNKWNEPNGNHVAVQTRGPAPNTSFHNSLTTLQMNTAIPDLNNGGNVQIDYNYVPNTFRVLINNNVYISIPDFNLEKYLKFDKGNAYIGFTGACANSREYHSISSWFFCPKISPLSELTISARTNTICDGDTLTLFATPGFDTYKWSTGEGKEKIIVSQPGTYTVTATDAKGEIYNSTGFDVYIRPLPKPVIQGDSIFCEGGKTKLFVDEDYVSYLWSTDDTTKSITVSKSGRYYLTIVDEYGCTNIVNKRVTIGDMLSPSIVIVGNNPVCYNDSVVLKTNNTYKKFKWSTGELTDSIFVSKSDSYFVEVEDFSGCKGISNKVDIMKLKFDPPEIAGDFELCEGSSGFLTVRQDFARYQWSTGDTSKTIKIDSSGSYRLDVTDSFGCIYDTTIIVKNKASISFKFLGKSVLCPGETIELKPDKDFAGYKWS